MDLLRSCYTTLMRFWDDDAAPLIPVRWYFIPENRPALPVPTVFTSRNWEFRPFGWPRVGEVEGADRPWANGTAPADPYHGHYCGTADEWAGLAVYDPDHLGINTAGDVPLCCLPPAERVYPYGGQGDDGSADLQSQVLVVRGPGQSDDSAATTSAGAVLVGSGGQGDDSAAVVVIPPVLLASGGQGDDSQAETVIPAVLVASGGQEDDSAATTSAEAVLVGSGGQGDDSQALAVVPVPGELAVEAVAELGLEFAGGIAVEAVAELGLEFAGGIAVAATTDVTVIET